MKLKRSSRGEIFVWGTGAAVTATFGILVVLLVVVMLNGLGYFWPASVALVKLTNGQTLMGEVTGHEIIPSSGKAERIQLKIGNRDLYGLDFRWVPQKEIASLTYPAGIVVLERQQLGNFYGTLKSVSLPPGTPTRGDLWGNFRHGLQVVAGLRKELRPLERQVEDLGRRAGAAEREYQRAAADGAGGDKKTFAALYTAFEAKRRAAAEKTAHLRLHTATFAAAGGKTKKVDLMDIVRPYRPNDMGLLGKTGFYLAKVWELLTTEPREANTEGGLLPAIFGTVMMVLLMSVFSIPLGVVAAIYLREYAREGPMVRLVRIAVFNLAGVPSIVFGVFGLGFFIYGVGGGIDRFFFADRLPTPTFGTGGILWASLTLALLTVPVVIVATEEALAGIPKGIREGSLSLGATQFQTLARVLLPMATPGILTGLILAMARAAGEVAPLMITGVVKLAPELPFDGTFPFLHLDRKFMHLGFHIYDVGFQSPNVEAAKPMVYVTTLLLVMIVLVLSFAAIWLRNSMRKRFQTATF